MKLFYYLIIVLVSDTALSGQSDISNQLNRLAEIKKESDPIARDTQLIWQYNFIAEKLARNLDPRTEVYLDTLQQLADQSDWDMAKGFYYRAMGRYHEFKGLPTEALPYYNHAINVFKAARGDLKELAFSYVLKGFLLSNSELHQECKKTLKEGIPYAKRARSKNSLCLMLDWFGDYYFYGLADTIDNNKALEYYLQVNNIIPEISYLPIIADNHAVLSGVYARLENTEKSQYHFSIADSLCTNNSLLHVRWGLYGEMASSLERQNNHLAANELYLTAYDFMQASPNIEFKSRVEKALWNNYKNIGNYQKALEHYESMIEMEEIIANDEVEKKYAELEAKYQFSIKENELNKLQAEKVTTTRNLAVVILTILLISAFLIYRKNRQLSKNFSLLEESQEETKQAIYRGETQERQRLAAELHDNVNTKLAAAKWQLEAVSEEVNGSEKEIVQNAINVLSDAYQDVRNISHNMVPASLESEGLLHTLNDLFQKLNNTEKVSFELSTDHLDLERIKKMTYPLYNIVLELINNILKHAQANSAVINMSNSNSHFHLSVSDDGKGYNRDQKTNGFGLKSIESRVKSLNGIVTVESKENAGTMITILIPL